MKLILLGVLLILCLTALPVSIRAADPSSDPAVASIDKFIADQKAAGAIKPDSADWKTKLPMPAKATFDPNTTYFWVLETNKGTIKIKLMPQVAPMHASSTIYLARLGFYDGLKFHRVLKGFMAQGGCPLGTGSGSPGYKYDGEFDANVKHDRPFLLSTANSGPGTDGSQFFLTFVPTQYLDGKHTIFGEVTEGQDVVRKLEAVGAEKGARPETPSEPLNIVKATIEVQKK